MSDQVERVDFGHQGQADDDEQTHCIVYVGPANREAVILTLSADEIDGMDGRSSWKWFRFPNGDLVLGVYPQGDTYFATENGRDV